MFPVPLLVIAAGLGFLALKKQGTSGPAVNARTGFLTFGRFHDLDLTAGDLVQLMRPDGSAATVTITGAQSAAYGPAFVGTLASGDTVVFQSQDVAALAPAGTSPTATTGWATSSTGLPPVFQVYNATDPSSLTSGAYVRLQDTRGSGTGIVAQITAPATSGPITGQVTAYQGAIVPPPSVTFTAGNVAYVAADASGTPPPGAATANFQPLTNPAFQGSAAGFVLSDVGAQDVVAVTAVDGTTIHGVIASVGPGGITAKTTDGPTPGSTIFFDVSEIQALAPWSSPTT